jgi:hypothetical protein
VGLLGLAFAAHAQVGDHVNAGSRSASLQRCYRDVQQALYAKQAAAQAEESRQVRLCQANGASNFPCQKLAQQKQQASISAARLEAIATMEGLSRAAWRQC